MIIQLVEIAEEDIELIRNWRNSPQVAQYMYTENLISIDQQKQWFNSIKQDKTTKCWIIVFKNQKIGLVSLTGISNVLNSCYWAFYIGEDNVRGAGLGAKIEYVVLDYVFNELKLNKLRCEVLLSNEKVISLHEKFGFRREAYYRQHVKKQGIWHDVVGLAILKQEWNLIKNVMQEKIFRT